MYTTNKWKLIPVAIGTALALATVQVSSGQESGDDEEEELEFEEADLFLELNDTDGDLGLQGFLEGDAWKRLEIEGPGDTELMNIWLRSGLRRQGLSEFFFESDEPGFDELSPAAFLRRFPQGTYEIEGITLEDEEIESEVFLSHVLASPPPGNVTLNGQNAAEDCDAPNLPVVTEPVTLDWNPVTQSHPTIGRSGVEVTVHHYEVVGEIEREGKVPDELVFSAILPRGRTKFEFPVDFTSLAEDEMKWELIIVLGNGNKTAVESCFEIE
ncbi:MAG: hypothetical protein ACRETY_07315 [Steroidobacteraceae bacterium]